MKRVALILLFLTGVAFAAAGQRVCAHRGYWISDAAKGAQNSIASLRAAGEAGLWGSEFDVHVSSDDVVVVNHDDEIDGLRIWDNQFSDLVGHRLVNGEPVPTLGSYLAAAADYPSMMLVIEFKWQKDRTRSDLMIGLTIDMLIARGLLDKDRVMFISFDYEACLKVASLLPGFEVQYLSGDKSPAELHEAGISGLDYHFSAFRRHPEWVEEAHRLGMSVNCWTVDETEDIAEMVRLGVDCITTNRPLEALSMCK